jgi:hypothetical protein
MPLFEMLALGIVLLSALPAAGEVLPQTTLVPSDAFKKNPDGSWSPVRQVMIAEPNGLVTVSPARSFWPGVADMGIDLGSRLQQQCKRHGAARGAPYLAAWPSGVLAPIQTCRPRRKSAPMRKPMSAAPDYRREYRDQPQHGARRTRQNTTLLRRPQRTARSVRRTHRLVG